MAQKRLYRSRSNRMIAGVAGGIAEYFDIDPVIIRLAFVVLALIEGIGILAYIIAWVVVPEEPADKEANPSSSDDNKKNSDSNQSAESKPPSDSSRTSGSGRTMIGTILILVGGLFLLQNVLGKIVWGVLWPLVLVAIGLGLVIRSLSDRRGGK